MFKKFGDNKKGERPAGARRPAARFKPDGDRAPRSERPDGDRPQRSFSDRPQRSSRPEGAERPSRFGGDREERSGGRSDFFKRRDGASSSERSPRGPSNPRAFAGPKTAVASGPTPNGPKTAPMPLSSAPGPRINLESESRLKARSSAPAGKRPFGGPKKSFNGKQRSNSGGRQQRPPRDPKEFQAANIDAAGAAPADVAATEKEPKRSIIQRSRQEVVHAAVESTMTFDEFNLPAELESALADAGFERPTPIQEKSLPHTLNGFDLIGCAQTGTGKTAAFVLPMITRLLEDEDSRALVLAPTRELAAQILDSLKLLTTHTKHIRHILIVGGMPYNEQVRNLRQNPRVIVATPGRLVDHLQQGTVKLGDVKFFVLDEADRMFDMGFAPQIDKIVKQIPKDRQTLLFSATFNKEVKALALKSLRSPKEVFIGAQSKPAAGVEQEIVETSIHKKFALLLDELNKREGTVLIFTAMKYRADKIAQSLEDYGHSAARIHGGRSMGQRKNALNDFKAQRVRILVATDIAARGLDISHVAHVINYDIPNDAEDYIHRIGRTARAGALGKALSFVTAEDKDNWRKITQLLATHK